MMKLLVLVLLIVALLVSMVAAECEITECNRFCHKIGRTVGLCVFGQCVCQ
ncbi:unnamed protein product [Acanthoscelides obtectus]|uniref:Uncharacterized protein n=1 Tax=Acanthoscelides obtectus TaxID=200917 RepID=A0A9P0M1A1_ACAOB|nr:unnamed protein product [Acanthoscelides obtectus]CAK1635563.1 hypothetical protein AOBTE_LOCUS9357 [Acanthoscelides obtectus]